MRKKHLLGATILVIAVILGIFYFSSQPKTETVIEGKCEVNQMVYYYLDKCKWCQKVKDEGTLSKLEQLGVEVKKINAAIGPIQHQFQGVPTFVINGEVYSGYQTFEQLKEKLGCEKEL